jgi:ceramide glucosyltransferase
MYALWRHELRWARTILGQRPGGYAGSVVTYVLPIAGAFALVARSPFAAAAFALAAVLRTWLHYEARRTFAPQTSATPALIPVRDCFGLAVWAAAFFGKAVRWKAASYRIDAGGRLAGGPKEM